LLRNVCVALGNIKDPVAVPGLIGALHDAEPLVRAHAAWALGQIGGPEATEALHVSLRDDPEESVREEARCALSWVEANEAVSSESPAGTTPAEPNRGGGSG
jgi:epoxyqueuosine reductase